MDIVTLGAAVALAKAIPDGAAERAEAAAERAEEAAASVADAVLYSAQTLTTAQQRQAQQNIAVERAVAKDVTPIDGNGYYYFGSTATTLPSFTEDTGYSSVMIDCSPGDIFGVRGNLPATNCRFGAWVDANNGIIPLTAPGPKWVVIAAPANTVKVLFQRRRTGTSSGNQYYQGGLPASARLDALETDMASALTVTETRSDASVIIIGDVNHSYVCTASALTALDFTPSATGLCEVRFTSGTTPTALVLPNTVKMPEWWTGVEANRAYDIMIMDGVYGAVMSWPT